MRLPMLPVDIPEGKLGEWEVKRGTYTGLYHGGKIIMSDTPARMRDRRRALVAAQGDILINGLGIGMYLYNCALKRSVGHITVVEISAEVLALVAPWYKERFGDRITFINDDALEYKPSRGTRFGFVWHDIWPTISADNWPDMKLLHRKYGKRCNNQKSWCRDEVLSINRSASI